VSPTFLTFGTAAPGEILYDTFNVTNTGAVPVNGAVTIPCPEITVTGGSENYSLLPGESHTVNLEFQSASPGSYSCTIGTPCGAVECLAEVFQPACDAPDTLDFGVTDGSYRPLISFSITNTGAETLNGVVETAAPCSVFAVLGGGGPYSLAPGASHNVHVAFQPTECDTFECTIRTGCKDVLCRGINLGDGCIAYAPEGYDFGEVFIGSYAELELIFRNANCEGDIINDTTDEWRSCLVGDDLGPAFTTPDSTYVIPAGDSVRVVVRFTPTSPGHCSNSGPLAWSCTQGGFAFTGTGVEPPGAPDVSSLQITGGSRINYSLEEAGPVTLQVYDAAGRLVRTLVNEHKPAGDYDVAWDRRTDGGRSVAPGIYFIKLKLANEADTKKMLIVQ
jgi:hypothetical protein